MTMVIPRRKRYNTKLSGVDVLALGLRIQASDRLPRPKEERGDEWFQLHVMQRLPLRHPSPEKPILQGDNGVLAQGPWLALRLS